MRVAALLFALLSAALPPTADSQALAPTAKVCTYDECALRLEGPRLLRGVQGVPVGRLTLWSGPRLTDLVSTNDSARMYAQRFDANYSRGSRLAFVGGLFLAAVGVDHVRGSQGTMRREHQLELGVAGVALALVGGIKLSRANQALSRAMFWHNRDLPR
jgi:hypothetical protein